MNNNSISPSFKFFFSLLFLLEADLSDSQVNSDIHPIHKPVGRFMWEVSHFPKPIIAAVNGPAVGVGVTMLLHCDIIICSNDTFFWTPFARIAVVPEMCSSLLLREQVGHTVANEMLLASKKLSASEALRVGFVSQVCEKSSVLNSALKIAQDMMSPPFASKSLPLFKSMIRSPQRMKLIENTILVELDKLYERFRSGETFEAAVQLVQQRAQAKNQSKL